MCVWFCSERLESTGVEWGPKACHWGPRQCGTRECESWLTAYLLAVVLSPLRLAMLSVAVLLQAAVRELQHCLTAQVAQ